MLELYYKIWVDAIKKINRNPIFKKDMKFITLAHITTMMGLNLMFISTILQKIIMGGNFYFAINLKIFENENYNVFIGGLVLYFLPPFLLNYFLIFKNNKYEILLEKYKDIKGYYFFSYYFGSIIIMLSILIIGFVGNVP